MTTSDVVLSPSAAHAFARDILLALGMPGEDAAVAADSMVWAGLHDRVEYSLIRLNEIARRIHGGALVPAVDWTPVRQQGNVTLIDAGQAWGVVAGARGMRYAIESAHSYGVGIASVRDCDGTEAMGWYSSLAVDERMLGVAVTNNAPQLAAWGGTKKVLGNHAFALAAPVGSHAPIVVDMSLGVAGSVGLEPMGGHRGFGLGLMWEVLTGVLSGGRMLTELHPAEAVGQPAGNSLFLLAVDPAALLPYSEFLDRAGQLVDRVHASPTAPGVDRVRVPGELGAEVARQRAAAGIPYPQVHMATLRALADRLGVREPG